MEPLHRDKNSTKSTELSGQMKLYLNTGEIFHILYCKVSNEGKGPQGKSKVCAFFSWGVNLQ